MDSTLIDKRIQHLKSFLKISDDNYKELLLEQYNFEWEPVTNPAEEAYLQKFTAFKDKWYIDLAREIKGTILEESRYFKFINNRIKINNTFDFESFQRPLDALEGAIKSIEEINYSYRFKLRTGSIRLYLNSKTGIVTYTKSSLKRQKEEFYKIEFNFNLGEKVSADLKLLKVLWAFPNTKLIVDKKTSDHLRYIKEVLEKGNEKSNPIDRGIGDKLLLNEIFERGQNWVRFNVKNFKIPDPKLHDHSIY